jgi:hypothetical protein
MDVKTTGKAEIAEDSTSHFEVLHKYDPSLKRGGMTT